jgi:hypothetical protein
VIALIRSAMCDLMPRTAALPGVADTGVTEFLLELRRDARTTFWLGLVLGAIVYALSPVLTLGIPLPAFVLSARLRELHAQRIVSSRLYWVRQAVSLVRLSAGLCWGRDPTVRHAFALPPYPPDPGGYRIS